MEFGQLPLNELEKISFRLPADPLSNRAVLSTGAGLQPRFYLGCAKWGRKEWLGKIYPKGTKEKDFLQHYAKHYNSIELNASNYVLYEPDKFKTWMAMVDNPDFRFCPKAHRAISFMKSSEEKKRFTDQFLSSIRTLGGQLGPVFMTLNGSYNPAYTNDFFTYLESLPRDISFFIELRDEKFYADKKLQQQYFSRLKELNIGAVITDTAGRQDVLHMQLTIPKAFIRFVGNSLHPTDFKRIDNWVTRMKKWLDQGIEEIYFFMHMHDEGLSPELTQYTAQQMNKKTTVKLQEIKFIDNNKLNL